MSPLAIICSCLYDPSFYHLGRTPRLVTVIRTDRHTTALYCAWHCVVWEKISCSSAHWHIRFLFICGDLWGWVPYGTFFTDLRWFVVMCGDLEFLGWPLWDDWSRIITVRCLHFGQLSVSDCLSLYSDMIVIETVLYDASASGVFDILVQYKLDYYY